MHHHHNPHYIRSLEAERARRGPRRHDRFDPQDLEWIVSAAENGDGTAWETLVTRFRTHLLRVARGSGLSAHDADDAVQEAWLRVFMHIGQLRSARALPAWLATTTRRESLRALAGAGREVPSDSQLGAELPAPDTDPGRVLDEAAHRDAVAHALAILTTRQRALMQALIADPTRSYAEISKELMIPIGSIGPTRSRCFDRLRNDPVLREAADALD